MRSVRREVAIFIAAALGSAAGCAQPPTLAVQPDGCRGYLTFEPEIHAIYNEETPRFLLRDNARIDTDRLEEPDGETERQQKRASAEHAALRAAAGLAHREGWTIRVFSWGSFGGRSSVNAYRFSSGNWEVEYVSEEAFPGAETATRSGRRAVEARLGRRLDAIVGDSCLYREPRYLGHHFPLVGGDESNCMDGSDSLIEVEVEGSRYVGFQSCQPHGLAGEAATILHYATEEDM